MQPQLVEAIDRRLAPGGLVFLQSDVMEVGCTPLPARSGSTGASWPAPPPQQTDVVRCDTMLSGVVVAHQPRAEPSGY